MSKKKAEAKVLLLSMALLFAGSAFTIQPASADSYNNVQVFASSAFPQPTNFQFAAYNLTGSLIASTQTSYPAAAFELPSGGYLFTVSASQLLAPSSYPCVMEGSGSSTGNGTAPPATPANKSGPAIVMPACYMPSSEYGFATATISSPETINIQMQNITKFSTNSVTVKVSYVNGTAASDASVYASIVGEYYWWWQGTTITMGAQTDANGVAHLVLPAAPSVVTAWKWVPIFTENGSTIQTTVGGEKVNVTIYWQPTYVGLSGSGLILPPQDNISLTLRYQQPSYWVMPMDATAKGAYVGGADGATIANQPTGTPSLASSSSGPQGGNQAYLPSQIPAIQATNPGGTTGSQPSFLGIDILTAAAIAAIGAATAIALLATRHHIKRSPAP